MSRALRVAVTRDEGPDGELAAALRSHGLEPVACPAVTFGPGPEPDRLADAARHLERYHWLVVASRRAVTALMEARAGAPVGILNPFKNIEIEPSRFDAAAILAAAPSAAVAVGLALRKPGDK